MYREEKKKGKKAEVNPEALGPADLEYSSTSSNN